MSYGVNKINLNWTYLTAAVILVVAVVRLPVGKELRPLFEFLVRGGIVFLMAVYFMQRVNFWVGALLLLALFSHSVPWYMISGRQLQTPESHAALNAVVFGCVLYGVLSVADIDEKIIFNVFCIIAVINSVFVILQVSGIDPYVVFLSKGNNSPTGLMSNRNETAALIAICSPAFFRKKWAWLIPLLIVALFCMRSLNGALGMGVAVSVFLYLKGYGIVAVFWPLIMLVSFIWYDDIVSSRTAIGERLWIWKNALILTYENSPIKGVGLGNWKKVDIITEAHGWYTGGNGLTFTRLHNTFIQGYVEMGVTFIILILGYLKSILSKNPVHMAAIGAVLVCCNTNSVFQMNAINGALVTVWAVMINRRKKYEQQKSSRITV